MATLLLKSLLISYSLIAVLGIGISSSIAYGIIFPLFFWPVTLIVSFLALLVLLAIREKN